jgi:Uma2 family endonuclease
MVSSTTSQPSPATTGPAWDVARLFPDQGAWTEQDYLAVTEDLNRLVELAHGRIEVLEMPKQHHQLIVDFLVALLNAFVRPRKLGRVVSAPFRIHLEANLFREPDVTFMRREHFHRTNDSFWEGADLAIEVVSPDAQSRERDYVTTARRVRTGRHTRVLDRRPGGAARSGPHTR